jgi:hypothetical protein
MHEPGGLVTAMQPLACWVAWAHRVLGCEADAVPLRSERNSAGANLQHTRVNSTNSSSPAGSDNRYYCMHTPCLVDTWV